VRELNASQWSFHTFEQALQDVVTFANNFTLPSTASALNRVNASDALHASKTPWVFIGGSYSGVRAATLRTRNPETIFASWASSAPVQAAVDMRSYYHPIAAALPANCSTDWATAIKFFDQAVTSSNASLVSTVKQQAVSAYQGNTVTASQTDSLSPETAASFLRGIFNPFQVSANCRSSAPNLD
jgi:hypothetical protein